MGKFTGTPYTWWWKPWFPVDIPFNQSIDLRKNQHSLQDIMPALSNCLDPHFLQPGRMWRTTNIKRQRIHKQMYNHTANHYKIWTLYKPLTFVYIHTLTHNCIKKKHNIYIYLLQHVYLHTSYINQTFIVYYIYSIYTYTQYLSIKKTTITFIYILQYD